MMRGSMRLDISIRIPTALERTAVNPQLPGGARAAYPRRIASHRGAEGWRGKLDSPELSTKPVSTDSLERVPFLRTFAVSKVIVGTEISGLAPAQPPLVRSLVVALGPSTSQE